MELGEPDAGGKKKPVPVAGSGYRVAADLVVTAAGLFPVTDCFSGEPPLIS